MHLAGLQRRPLALAGDDEAAGEVRKGVASLVGYDLHVARRAVEVGEDEGAVVAAEGGAVAAAGLALAGENVQQLVIVHEVDELGGLAAQLVIELAPGGEDVVRRALGLRVAAAELEGVVGVVHRVGLAEALGLAAVDGVGQGDDVLDNGLAEGLDVLLRVAVALHAVVAEGNVVAVAELLSHRVAQVHQLVIDGVQLVRVGHVPGALGLPGGEALGVVTGLLEGGHLGERVHAAVELYLGGGEELGVLGAERILLLQLGHDLGGEGAHVYLLVEEDDGAVLLRELGPPAGGDEAAVPAVDVLLQLGQGGIGVFHLGVVELVGGVDVVADVGDGEHGVEVGGVLVHLDEYGVGGLKALGGVQPCGGVGKELLCGLDIGALIGHFREFQHFTDLPPDIQARTRGPFLLWPGAPTAPAGLWSACTRPR